MEFFDEANKEENIKKYGYTKSVGGVKNRKKEKKILKDCFLFCFFTIFCVLFFLVVIFGGFYLNEKNKEIEKLKKEIDNKNIKIQRLEFDLQIANLEKDKYEKDYLLFKEKYDIMGHQVDKLVKHLKDLENNQTKIIDEIDKLKDIKEREEREKNEKEKLEEEKKREENKRKKNEERKKKEKKGNPCIIF